MSDRSFVGVDVGGGGIRVQAEIRRRPLSRRLSVAVSRDSGRINVAVLARRIADLVDFDPPTPIDRLAIGMTGMPELLVPAELAEEVTQLLPCRELVIASDALTSHLGALGGAPGTIVAAGTGVIACATDHRRSWVRRGGWGHLVGDEGSGAWIGAEAIRAALRQADGRPGGSVDLLAALEARWGSPRAAVELIYSSPAPVHEIAAFARDAAAVARAGDITAGVIWEQAAEQLAQLAIAAGREFEPTFSWAGRLFDAGELIIEPICAAILKGRPGATIVPPLGQSADGALLLAHHGLADVSPFGQDAVRFKSFASEQTPE